MYFIKNQELIIQKAAIEDAEALIEYLNSVGGESDNLLFGRDDFNLTVEQEQSFINKINSSLKSCMILGKINGVIVSVASIAGNERERIAHRAEMAVTVRKEYWGLGIGNIMIGELIKFAIQCAQIDIIGLQVRSDNERAIRLYEKLGFEKFGTYKKFFKIDTEYYDAIYMNLYL